MATVLLIDESLESGSKISEILDRAGHNVVLTIEPQRALELCADINFDIIMCELCLREAPHRKNGSLLVGMDTLWKLVDQQPDLPIIALNRYIDQSTLEAIRKLGVYETVSHPLDEASLLQKVDSALLNDEPTKRVPM